jgi:hypothetical protein
MRVRERTRRRKELIKSKEDLFRKEWRKKERKSP